MPILQRKAHQIVFVAGTAVVQKHRFNWHYKGMHLALVWGRCRSQTHKLMRLACLQVYTMGLVSPLINLKG